MADSIQMQSDEPLLDENYSHVSISSIYGVIVRIFHEPFGLLYVLVAVYGTVFLPLPVLIRYVFGSLRVIEFRRIKNKLWNFLFYKFIFIFGVMNTQTLYELLLWLYWFAAIGFIVCLTKISKDRFEFLSSSPTTLLAFHKKVIILLVVLLFFCITLFASCITMTFPFLNSSNDNHTVVFMLAECTILAIKVAHVLIKYCIHHYDLHITNVWEKRSAVVHYVNLVMETLSFFLNLVHHLHILLSRDSWFSMAGFVVLMQLRFIVSEIQKCYYRHKRYQRINASMEIQFPSVSAAELQEHADRCAICWDEMKSARKLPCGHLYHTACLRSWLEQDSSCPTCRKQLNTSSTPSNPNNQGATGNANAQRNQTYVWNFDGTRIASWLPNFSVEILHSNQGTRAVVTAGSRHARPSNAHMARVRQMAQFVRSVQEVFPQVPANVIANDLLVTRSVAATTTNILERNITIPPTHPTTTTPSTHPTTALQTTLPNSTPSFPTTAPPSDLNPIPQASSTSTFQPAAGTELRRRNVVGSISPISHSSRQVTAETPSSSTTTGVSSGVSASDLLARGESTELMDQTFEGPSLHLHAHTNHLRSTASNLVGHLAGDASFQSLLNSMTALYNPSQRPGNNNNLPAEQTRETSRGAPEEQASEVEQQPSVSQLSEEALD